MSIGRQAGGVPREAQVGWKVSYLYIQCSRNGCQLLSQPSQSRQPRQSWVHKLWEYPHPTTNRWFQSGSNVHCLVTPGCRMYIPITPAIHLPASSNGLLRGKMQSSHVVYTRVAHNRSWSYNDSTFIPVEIEAHHGTDLGSTLPTSECDDEDVEGLG